MAYGNGMRPHSLKRIHTPNEAIDMAGGTAVVARRFGVQIAVVSNWRARGFPPDSYVAWQRLLNEHGCMAPPSLWGQRQLAY